MLLPNESNTGIAVLPRKREADARGTPLKAYPLRKTDHIGFVCCDAHGSLVSYYFFAAAPCCNIFCICSTVMPELRSNIARSLADMFANWVCACTILACC